jgi:hypothetical protein
MQSRARTQFPCIVASEAVAAVVIVAGTAGRVVKGSYIFLDYSRRGCGGGLR